MYQNIIDQISTVPDGKYQNLILINNYELKYRTLEEMHCLIAELCHKHLSPGGRLIVSFEQRFIIYDRINISVQTFLNKFVQKFQDFKLVASVNLLGKSPEGYGDYFFCFEKNE